MHAVLVLISVTTYMAVNYSYACVCLATSQFNDNVHDDSILASWLVLIQMLRTS